MNQATNEELDKFSKLVAEWLQTGKMWISPVPDYHNEEEQEELHFVLQFPAGSEIIGNEEGTNFKWQHIFSMAKAQGLLS